jgi:hypothetical protein
MSSADGRGGGTAASCSFCHSNAASRDQPIPRIIQRIDPILTHVLDPKSGANPREVEGLWRAAGLNELASSFPLYREELRKTLLRDEARLQERGRGGAGFFGRFWEVSREALVPGTGLEPASREAADFRHTTSFDAARIARGNARVRALDYAFAVAAPRISRRVPRQAPPV